jgi:hypothetical protein
MIYKTFGIGEVSGRGCMQVAGDMIPLFRGGSMNGWLKRYSACLIALSAVCLWAASEAIEAPSRTTLARDSGVTVVLTSVDTGATRQALSDDGGFFVFSNIKPGNYEIRAELEDQPVRSGHQAGIGDSSPPRRGRLPADKVEVRRKWNRSKPPPPRWTP